MKTILTLLSLGACALSTHAQPTLTQATNAPQAGTSFSFNYGPYVQPGSAGALQTWDLSALTTDSIVEAELVLASATPNGAQFPTADVAEVNDVVTTYYDVTSDGAYFAGSDDGTTVIPNTQMGKFLPFPCTFGSTWSSPQSATFTSEGTDVFRTGFATGEADGYGTLIMPWGTVTNVLRVHWVSELRDSTQFFNIDYTYDAYLYYVTGQSYPIAELVTATVDLFGSPSTSQFSRWTGEITMGTDGPARSEGRMHAYPNPATDGINIVVTEDMGVNPSVLVLDAAGKLAHQQVLSVAVGSTAPVDLSALVPGTYTLVVVDRKGLRSTAQVVLR